MRCAEPASFASVASRDWLRSRVHSGGPSSLSPQPNRAPKAAMYFSSYGAHADMLGARFGVRAAEDGHLTLLRAHGMALLRARRMLAAAFATHPMRANATGDCRDRALVI
jgi:hypothetical protein